MKRWVFAKSWSGRPTNTQTICCLLEEINDAVDVVIGVDLILLAQQLVLRSYTAATFNSVTKKKVK